MGNVEKNVFDDVITSLEASYKYSNVDEESTIIPQDLLLGTITLLKASKQIQWERDVAIEQLHSIGKELGQTMDDVKVNTQQFPIYKCDMAFCPSCKFALSMKWKYCPNCGQAIKLDEGVEK